MAIDPPGPADDGTTSVLVGGEEPAGVPTPAPLPADGAAELIPAPRPK